MLAVLPEALRLMDEYPGAAEMVLNVAQDELAVQKVREVRASERGNVARVRQGGEGAAAAVSVPEGVEACVADLRIKVEELLAEYRANVQETRERDSGKESERFVAALDAELDENVSGLVDEAGDLMREQEGDGERDAVFDALVRAFLKVGDAHRAPEAQGSGN